MAELTAHEAALQQKAREDGQRASLRTERQDLRRLCPVNSYVDLEHLGDLMHQGPAGNRPFLLWRHFAAVGMQARGYSAELITRALNLAPGELDAVLAPISPWRVPEDVQRRFTLLYPEHAPAPKEPTAPTGHPREDYPFLNTDGYRVEGPLNPGIRTRTLSGNTPITQR